MATIEPRDPAGLLIPVAVSARHVHLSRETIERLFGRGYDLNPAAPLTQPGQYAAKETVTLIGPHGRLEHVRVLGPPRESDQIEISGTDERVLGIRAPVRLSGDLGATPGVTIEGPAGHVTVPHGVVCALRHIHMNPQDAARLGVKDREVVAVAIGGTGRDVVFGDVVVRVSGDYRLELHLDTDEGNAAGVETGTVARLLNSHGRAAPGGSSTRS